MKLYTACAGGGHATIAAESTEAAWAQWIASRQEHGKSAVIAELYPHDTAGMQAGGRPITAVLADYEAAAPGDRVPHGILAISACPARSHHATDYCVCS